MLTGPTLIPNNPQTAVVLLHGYGSNGTDMISLAEEWVSALPQTAFFAPNAPTPVWGDGFEWFSLDDFQSADMVTFAYLQTLATRTEAVVPTVVSYLKQISQTYRIPYDQFILGGFSQGGLVALKTAFSLPESICAIIGMSAVPLVEPVQTKNCLSVLLTHGEQDDVVPIEAMNLSERVLKSMNQSVQTVIRPYMGHGIDSNCAKHIRDFIQHHFETKANHISD